MEKSNINPVYQGLWNQGTTSTTTTLVAYSSGASAAFAGLWDQGTTSTTTSLASSTYQYVGAGSPLVPVSSTYPEYSLTTDVFSKFVGITKTFSEYHLGADFFFDGTKDIPDYALSTDTLHISVGKTFTEYGLSVDSFTRGGQLTSNQPLADGLFTSIVKYFNEYNLATDEPVDAFPFFDESDSMVIMVEPMFADYDSMSVRASLYDDGQDSMVVVNLPTSMAPVVNPSSLSNPFLPTLILGGVTYVTNACTAPPPGYVVTPQTYYVQYLNSPIGNTSFCQMTGSNLSLTNQGGTFSISSQAPLGTGTSYTQNLAQTISAYGLVGTITDYGKDVSTSQNSYFTSGIFGSPNLNKPFNLITYGTNQYFSFLSNQYGLNYAPPIDSFTTVKGMAQAIAALCGINLSWVVPDAPYHDIFGQSGLTGMDALTTLAGQVGAGVLWNGGYNYTIAYPDYHSGMWILPNEYLLEGRFSYRWHEDLGYGVSGSGVLGIPTNVYFDSAVKTVPVNQATANNQENVERIASVTKPLTSSDPPIIVDLDNDIISVKIQILVPAGRVGGGRYVTDNSSIWFDLGSPAISNPYVKVVKVGQAYRNQLWIDYNLYPNLSAINNGNFTMNFGIIRRSLNTDFENAKQDANLLLRELQSRIAANVRFIKTYTGTFSYKFFGSFPVPGMWASATYCGETIEGIVESVDISGAGIVTVNVARYLRINFLDAKLNWALTTGNYTNL